MDLSAAIYSNAQNLPADLQREALDFIAFLKQRYCTATTTTRTLDTETFIQKFAGCLEDDFPDDITSADLPNDSARERIE